MGKRLQFVWWGWRRWHFGFRRLDASETDLALIYRWVLSLGPVEIRRWACDIARLRSGE